jgi:DNA invertase Pin-like site-specific DNA recombinase
VVALTGQLSNPYAPLLRLLRLNRGDEAAVALAVGRPMTTVSGVVKQTQRRLTLEQQTELVRRYEAGAQMSYLANHFGVHRSTVSAILKRHGVEPRRQELSSEQIQHAVLMYAQGNSLAVIGARLGVDGGTVHKRLCQQGVVMRDAHGRER